jgi:hypothetical protein
VGGSAAYVLVVILALAVLAVLVLLGGRGGGSRLTPLAGVAFACVVFGIAFGEDRLVSYGLIGAGVALAIVDMILKQRGRRA